MSRYRLVVSTLLAALSVATLSVLPLLAQTPQGTKVGVLTCRLSPSIGLIIGSRQRMSCRYAPDSGGPPEFYTGVMSHIGLDIGITAGGVLAWESLHQPRALCMERWRAPINQYISR